jgi:SAM-dependent methyltransferase
MNEIDKQKIIERYNLRLQKFGTSIEALASGVEERRQLRFNILFECGIKPGDHILDLGCGFGDFYYFLENRLGKNNFKYTGIDINPNLIEIAKKNIPKAEFLVHDITTNSLSSIYNFVVSTSCFNLKLENEDNYLFAQRILESAYNISTEGVAIDFLTSYVDFQGVTEAFYYSPETILSISKKITKRVAVRHDYQLFEFCIYLYKDFEGWKKK